MPVSTDNLYNIKRVNVVFAVSSVLLLVSMCWMLWHDYDRPWRETQTEYFNLRSAMAHFDVLRYDSPAEQENWRKLRTALEKAEAELAAPEKHREVTGALQAEKEISGRLQGAGLTFGNENAELAVLAFDYEETKTLHGEDDARTQAALATYEDGKEKVAAAKKRQDRLEDALREVKTKIKGLYRRRDLCRKTLVAYEKGRADALTRDKMFRPGFSRTAFNFPGLDFAAPKGVAGRQEIKQIFMPSIRFNYNFVDSYVTDRCITCHLGIDDPSLTVESFVKTAEAAMTSQRVSQVIRAENIRLREELLGRLGRSGDDALPVGQGPSDEETKTDRATLVRALVEAANAYLSEIDRPRIDGEAIVARLRDRGDLTRGQVTEEVSAAFMRILTAARPVGRNGKGALAWEDMDDAQREAHFKSLLAAMNTYLGQEGRPRITFGKELRAHPDLDLYVGLDSPHPMKKMGCTICHEGSGQETDFVLAAHTPKTQEEKEAWKRKYYVKELGLPLARFRLVEEYWERPMLLPDYTSASCRKCHEKAYDLERYQTEPLDSARRIVRGRDLFTTIGCIDCHNVDGLSESRRVGPDLTRVTEKLSGPFMERWIQYPNDFRPSTRMPHFFRQENNLPSSANADHDPDPVLRTETEIQAIAHYLRTFSTSYDPKPLPEGITGDPQRGEALFVSIGCLACHANLDAKDPLDEDGRSFGEVWLTADLMHVARLEGKQPSVDEAGRRYASMSKNDRVRYAMRRLTPERRRRLKKIAEAEAIAADLEGRDPDPIKMYVPAAFTRFAPELSGIGTKLVPDRDDPQQVRQGRRWLYNWLLEPRHYHTYTKMPRMFRDSDDRGPDAAGRERRKDQDILDVAAYLLTLRHDGFDLSPIPEDERHREMRHGLILTLLGGQNTEGVSKKILDDRKLDPSAPYGELTRAIVSQTYRAFGGGDAGKARVSAMIEAKSGSLEERRKLFLGMKAISHYGCFACHTIAGFEDATRPGTDMTLWAQKFMSQLDFAFYSPAFEEELKKQPEVFANLYIESPEYAHLIRDIDGNRPHEILHNHGAFAYHKVRNPRIWDRGKIKKPYEKLKMPNFFLTDEEARSLVTFLLSRREPNVRPGLRIAYDATTAGQVAAGRALVRELNCIGCHTIEGDEANIQQYYTDDPSVADDFPFGRRFKPPLLWGEGAKIQYDWLFTFLNNVEMLRPWLKVRMPSFALTSENTTTLVEHFAGLSRLESDMLRDELAPVAKYLAQVHAGGAHPDGDASRSAGAWFLEDTFARQAALFKRYALANKQVGPYDFDVGDAGGPAEVAGALGPTYEKIVGRLSFLSDLFDVAYPFADTRAHTAGDAAFRLGEELFYNQRCLACHVAGDPTVEGTTANIKAPNFALTHKRLRYDWVVKWLQDPQAIQPGANMPQIFQGGSAFAALPAQQRETLEQTFGERPEEQWTLLVDFLYELGRRRHTAIQPGGLGEAEAGEEEMEEGFDDEDEFEDEFEDQALPDRKEKKEEEEEEAIDAEAFEP